MEVHDTVETVPELGGEGLLQRLENGVPVDGLPLEADGLPADLPGAGVRGHQQDHVAEIRLLAVVVGERRVVHDLQERVEDVGMGLLDLVQQENRVGVLPDRLGEEAALLVADVARRRPDELGHGVLLLVLAHVVAEERHPQRRGKLAGEFGLSHPRRPHEEERGDGLVRFAEAGARPLDRLHDPLHGLVLAEDPGLQFRLQILEFLDLRGGDALLRDPGDPGDDGLDLPLSDRHPLHWRHRTRFIETKAPASSITSIALSGRRRSLM